MNWLLKKLLEPRHMEYLATDEALMIQELSFGVQRFADRPHEVKLGCDVRLGFPELIGLERVLREILLGKQSSFELKSVARFTDERSPFYFDIYAFSNPEESDRNNRLMILFENVTEIMVVKQNLVQTANEASLLLTALTASKDYIDKIIRSMGDALLVTQASGTIKTVNQAAQRLFRYSEAELEGQSICFITGEDDLKCQSRHDYILTQGELLTELEIPCQTKTGEDIWVEFSCSAIQTEVEGLYEFVYIGRDITERKLEDLAIRQSLAKEKELREIRSRFFSMIAHEFGSPLDTVMFSAQLLKEAATTEEKKNYYLDHIKTATRHMTQLLNDVRFISSAEAGKLEFNPSPTNLSEFCKDLVDEIRLGIGKKHTIDLIEKISEKDREFLKDEVTASSDLFLIDNRLLRHILTNLLGNAIKYSPQGTPVSLEILYRDSEIAFQIQDRGIGIPLEDQQQLFEAFYRAKNVGKISGTGLGLAIVKQCVDLQGGSIAFSSKVDRGTTFKVTIPIERDCTTS